MRTPPPYTPANHLGPIGLCCVCYEPLDIASNGPDILEGYALAIEDVTKSEDDDVEDAEEARLGVQTRDPSELFGSFCADCTPKVRIAVERLVHQIRDRELAEKDDGDAPAA